VACRLAVLLIAAFGFATDLLTHIVVHFAAVALDQRLHWGCCRLPLFRHEEARRAVHWVQKLVLVREGEGRAS
jgi:hypothetical protein